MRTVIKNLSLYTVALVFFLLSFAGVAFAAGAVTDDNASILDYLQPIYIAFRDGNKVYAGALAVVAALALLKRYAANISPKLAALIKGDVGGSVFALLLSFSGSVAAAFSSGTTPFSWGLVWSSGHIAVAAAGGYTLVKKLIMDPLLASDWYKTKASTGVKTIVGLVAWIFDEQAAQQAIITKAEADGAAAVAASPAKGVDAGKPVELK